MMLTDAGVLIALFEPREIVNHSRCIEVYRSLNEPLITTLACITEAMYFLGNLKGWASQKDLWRLIETESLVLYHLNQRDLIRMMALIEKYRDVPMDFADASLVVAAEALRTQKIFTLDSDFTIYRINGRTSFEIIP